MLHALTLSLEVASIIKTATMNLNSAFDDVSLVTPEKSAVNLISNQDSDSSEEIGAPPAA